MLDFSQLPLPGKLANFEMRVSTRELSAQDAASMLASIHTELNDLAGSDREDYEQYVQVVQTFRQPLPDVYQQVVSGWQGQRSIDAGDEPRGGGEPGSGAARASHEPGEASEAKGGEEEGGEEGGEEGDEEEVLAVLRGEARRSLLSQTLQQFLVFCDLRTRMPLLWTNPCRQRPVRCHT